MPICLKASPCWPVVNIKKTVIEVNLMIVCQRFGRKTGLNETRGINHYTGQAELVRTTSNYFQKRYEDENTP